MVKASIAASGCSLKKMANTKSIDCRFKVHSPGTPTAKTIAPPAPVSSPGTGGAVFSDWQSLHRQRGYGPALFAV
jgi:hypothetical protein